jgi:hypothetical protein
MPDQPGGCGNAHQEHNGSGGEQKAKKANEQSHKSLSGREPGSSSAEAPRPGRIPLISIEFNCVGLMVALRKSGAAMRPLSPDHIRF